MGEPLAAMPRRDAIARAAGHASQISGGAGRVFPHMLLLQRPTGLDWIQIGRVRGQVQHADAAAATGRSDAAIVLGAQIVHDQDVAPVQAREQVASQPGDKPVRVRRRTALESAQPVSSSVN
jgi:hypothetical protein